MTTLVITDSIDVTADLVIPKLAPDVFRLNADLIRDYRLTWSLEGFSISDPTSRELRSEDVTAVYWRKPFMTSHYDHRDDADGFFYVECRYAIRELYNICKAAGARCLVEEGAERRLGKLMQLQIASRFFSVPHWQLTLGATPASNGRVVVKCLAGQSVDAETCLYTTRVQPSALDPEHLWLTQREIDKRADVTVVYVDGQLFAFRCAALPEWLTGASGYPALARRTGPPTNLPRRSSTRSGRLWLPAACFSGGSISLSTRQACTSLRSTRTANGLGSISMIAMASSRPSQQKQSRPTSTIRPAQTLVPEMTSNMPRPLHAGQ